MTMWPVGLVTSFGVSSPIVKNGQVVGFYDGWNGSRKFPVDMAGFAININMFLGVRPFRSSLNFSLMRRIFQKPNANMPWVAGYEEDQLLKTLGVSMPDIVPLANNCSEVRTLYLSHAVSMNFQNLFFSDPCLAYENSEKSLARTSEES